MVKLYDIVASTTRGKTDVKKVISVILGNIMLAQAKFADENPSTENAFLPSLLSSAFSNYWNYYPECFQSYVQDFLAQNKVMRIPYAKLTPSARAIFLKMLISNLNSGIEVFECIDYLQDQITLETCSGILFSRQSFHEFSDYARFCCFSRLILKDEDFIGLLGQALTLWADQNIAKGHIGHEVVHFTRLAIVLFSHLSPALATSQSCQADIIRLMTTGLPNHFSSTDPRSIQLAKYFCEVVTEFLRFYEGRAEDGAVPANVLDPVDPICKDMLAKTYHGGCDESKHFWSNFYLECPESLKSSFDEKKIEKVNSEPLKSRQESDDEDDDDDDLEPIESLNAMQKSNVAYIRDFIEDLGEFKTYDEIHSAFSSLPNVIKYQLGREHPQVGQDLINILVRWDNEYDSPEIDQFRKRSLCGSLMAKMDGNAQHMCSLFMSESTRVPQQIMLLEVMTTVMPDVSLKDLETLSKSAFSLMLDQDVGLIRKQEVPVRIPTILFFHRLLTTLPVEMVREKQLTSYLKALADLGETGAIDSGTQQTVAYSLHHLVDRLRDVHFLAEPSDDLHNSLANVRNWIMTV